MNIARRKQVRRYCVRDILKKREGFGTFHTLLEELKHGREYLFPFLSMTQERFEHLLALARQKIEKQRQELNAKVIFLLQKFS